jgi:PAS domain S-box-containing protein
LKRDITLITADGDELLIHARIILITDKNEGSGYMISATGFVSDSQAKEELERLRKDQMVLLENSSDCVILVTDGCVDKANSRTIETFGYSQGELEGMGIDVLFKDNLKGIRRIPYESNDMEIVYAKRKDGSNFPAEVDLITFNGSGLCRSFVFVKDISERLQKEEKLRLLAGIIETSSDAVVVLDPRGDVITVNSGLKKIFEITGSEVGWDPREMFGGSEKRYLEMISSLMDGMKWSGYSKIDSGSTKIEISINAWPMMDSNTSVDYLIIHCRDVSDIRRIHEDMELLSSILSHDIRNFDKAITDNLTLMKMGVYGDLDDRKEKVVTRILAQSKGMNMLISNSRKVLQSFREISDLEIFDLRSVVLYATDLIRSSYPERKIDVSVEFNDPPPLVRADILIRDIFQNLLDNSVKYSDDEVKVLIKGFDSREGWYSVVVSDDGIGMPEGKGEELFTLFKGSTRSSGTGMGLYLVKRLMERYGGKVAFREKGQTENYGGAEFRLDFPRISKTSSILYDTINTDISDPVRYVLFRKLRRDDKNLIEFGGDIHDLDELASCGKMDLIERFGWNISRAIYETIRYVDKEGVYRYDFENSRISGPIDPGLNGDEQ